MKAFVTTAFLAAFGATASLAAGMGDHDHGTGHMNTENHASHGHDDGHAHMHGEMMAAGMPGDRAKVSRTVEVRMVETEDGDMLFEPGELAFEKGETVLFKIMNMGELEHEFVLDSYANNMEHRDLMMKFPEMEHDDPNSVKLAPGEAGEIVWTFAKDGYFHFACLIPGHMEAGMHGPVKVSQ